MFDETRLTGFVDNSESCTGFKLEDFLDVERLFDANPPSLETSPARISSINEFHAWQ
jgi:hypothetical protein